MAGRLGREELRELLLASGRAILREEGLGTGAEAVTFKRVFDRIEQERGVRLTNASVIRRVWENVAEYQIELMASVAREESDGDIEFGVRTVGPMIAAIDRSTPEARTAGMREICRVGGDLYAQTVREPGTWPLWIGVWALVANGESGQYSTIQAALLDGYETFTRQTESLWAALATFLGYRLKKPFALRHFMVALNSLGHGFGLRQRIDRTMTRYIVRPTGPNGSIQSWAPYAVAFEGLVNHYWELMAEWTPEETGRTAEARGELGVD